MHRGAPPVTVTRTATGFIGAPPICAALTDTGHLDVAHRLLAQTACPSWVYPTGTDRQCAVRTRGSHRRDGDPLQTRS
ncbi:alpha-L-rhamnosidase-related protein [Streptomyces flaveolus]|uniref:alpha-L-rhamnosidase-related protein n=1 Tax=Streptomyces flaveolus TaxID=67297 RepID=UPI0038258D6A